MEGTISDYPRLASSVSHVYGKPRAFTESFAAYRPVPDVEMARYIVNEQFVRGINLVEMMYFPATSSGPKPPPSYMGEPGFPELLTYVRRMSYLMAMGRPDANVALLLPSSSMWLENDASDTAFVSTERLLSEHQIDFDIVSKDGLARDLKADKGTFETQSGNSYRTVILPDPMVIASDTMTRLKAFAEGGGKVLFLGGAPRLIAGRTIRDARPATASDFAWATIETAQLPPTPTPPAFPPAEPPPPEAVSPEVLAALASSVVQPVVRLDTPDTALRVMKRRWKNADVYLFFNEGARDCSDAVVLMTTGRTTERWDAQTGSVSALKSVRNGGHPTVQLHLQPYETEVVVVH